MHITDYIRALSIGIEITIRNEEITAGLTGAKVLNADNNIISEQTVTAGTIWEAVDDLALHIKGMRLKVFCGDTLLGRIFFIPEDLKGFPDTLQWNKS